MQTCCVSLSPAESFGARAENRYGKFLWVQHLPLLCHCCGDKIGTFCAWKVRSSWNSMTCEHTTQAGSTHRQTRLRESPKKTRPHSTFLFGEPCSEPKFWRHSWGRFQRYCASTNAFSYCSKENRLSCLTGWFPRHNWSGGVLCGTGVRVNDQNTVANPTDVAGWSRVTKESEYREFIAARRINY